VTRRNIRSFASDAAARVPVRAPARYDQDRTPDPAGAPATRRGNRGRREEQRRRDERQRRLQRRKARRGRRSIVLLVALGLVVGAGGFAASVLWPMVTSLTESNDYTGSGSGVVSVAVHRDGP
jgi:hypothetical protein